MVGEIRDTQTARVAMQAALTGHLVLSTVHTNNAPSTVVRLMDMGIEPYLINAALVGVLAQRLVKTLCESCKKNRPLTPAEREEYASMGIQEIYEAPGCAACGNHGFKGRTGIFEFLPITADIRTYIHEKHDAHTLYEKALHHGMKTLTHDAREKIKQGMIGIHELALLGI
jgi:type II secretory ATPase GspE/PulE/Tfp pilus assembly ATPase PilB-like protein